MFVGRYKTLHVASASPWVILAVLGDKSAYSFYFSVHPDALCTLLKTCT